MLPRSQRSNKGRWHDNSKQAPRTKEGTISTFLAGASIIISNNSPPKTQPTSTYIMLKTLNQPPEDIKPMPQDPTVIAQLLFLPNYYKAKATNDSIQQMQAISTIKQPKCCSIEGTDPRCGRSLRRCQRLRKGITPWAHRILNQAMK